MLVKKFEAPSMKEALQMVKTHLGPDAVILAARENGSNFGLMKNGSVEVTAAVSETQLKKKQFAESRLKPEDKERLRNKSATSQRAFIQKSVQRFSQDGIEQDVAREVRAPAAQQDRARRYIEIDDEVSQRQPAPARRGYSAPSAPSVRSAQPAAAEVTPAIARPKMSAATFVEKAKPFLKSATPSVDATEVTSLKAEVQQLRTLLESFRSHPAGGMTYHPGADQGLPFEVSGLYEKLIEAGISVNISAQLCRGALSELTHDQLKKKSLIEGWAARKILNDTVISQDPTANGFHLFVGPSGQGKTSALVKFASHLVLKERKSVAILTCDTQKVGAADQLKIFSSILNVPFGTIRSKADWERTVAQLAHTDCVLVDYSGLALKNGTEMDYLQNLLPPPHLPRHTHLVLSVNQRDADALEFARRYRLTQYKDIIFTKLDESTTHGIIYTAQKEVGVALHSFGVGPLIPEDYELATKERLVDLIFRISKLKGT